MIATIFYISQWVIITFATNKNSLKTNTIFWLPLEPVLEIWRIRAFFPQKSFVFVENSKSYCSGQEKAKFDLAPFPPPPAPESTA
jgi:hypothetical protein